MTGAYPLAAASTADRRTGARLALTRPQRFREPRRGNLSRVSVQLSGAVDGDPTWMTCEQCGASAPFDPSLPYVKQTTAFDTGHRCEIDLRAPT